MGCGNMALLSVIGRADAVNALPMLCYCYCYCYCCCLFFLASPPARLCNLLFTYFVFCKGANRQGGAVASSPSAAACTAQTPTYRYIRTDTDSPIHTYSCVQARYKPVICSRNGRILVFRRLPGGSVYDYAPQPAWFWTWLRLSHTCIDPARPLTTHRKSYICMYREQLYVSGRNDSRGFN